MCQISFWVFLTKCILFPFLSLSSFMPLLFLFFACSQYRTLNFCRCIFNLIYPEIFLRENILKFTLSFCFSEYWLTIKGFCRELTPLSLASMVYSIQMFCLLLNSLNVKMVIFWFLTLQRGIKNKRIRFQITIESLFPNRLFSYNGSFYRAVVSEGWGWPHCLSSCLAYTEPWYPSHPNS